MREGLQKSVISKNEVIYIDESIFSGKHLPKRAWSGKRKNIKPTMMLIQESCLAVVAAISKDRGLIGFRYQEKSFKSTDFLNFVKELRQNTEQESFSIVLDNCSIHKGKILQ